MTKTKTCNTKTMAYTIPKKKAAIKAIIGTKITRSSMLKAAHDNGLSLRQLRLALSNFMNFGYIDGRSRTKWQNASRSEGLLKKIVSGYKHPKAVSALYKRIESYKIGGYTATQAGNLIHEFIFSSELRTMRYLDSKHINQIDWYAWLNELSEKGTLLGHKVIDYKTQSKIRLTTAIKIIRWKTRKNANRGSKYYFQHCSYSKNLSKSDYMLIRHIEHTLDLNL